MDTSSIATAIVLAAIVELRVKVGRIEKSLDHRMRDHVSRMHRLRANVGMVAGTLAGLGYFYVSTLS
jgi:hypothetical protein